MQISETGGARIGSGFGAFNASWPLATLEATEEQLRLSAVGREFVFHKSSIVRLCRHKGIFSTGLRIEHSVDDYPVPIVFWTFRFGRVREGLNALGYDVTT